MKEYEITIGLEVHAELRTQSKIYCTCKNVFGGLPNTQICPICMALPGTLPMLNARVVEYAIRMGHALNCRINTTSRQDRKNYFYPDLPKAYQISQAEVPLCADGFLDVMVDGIQRRIGIERIHIEEDAGKLLHDTDDVHSLVDLNRCGVPLIEIVTRPDMHSSSEAKAFLETVKAILLYLDISDCKMQEGSMRCDVNVSVSEKGSGRLGTRCEMKNVNSFSAAVRSIVYEAKRQKEILDAGGEIEQETRRWDDAKGRSIVMRTKENAQDYRFFPEPDLPMIVLDEAWAAGLKSSIPELPNAKVRRYMEDFGFAQTEAALIAEEKERAVLFDACVDLGRCKPKSICSRILSEVAQYVNETGLKISETPLTAEHLTELIVQMETGVISSTAAHIVFAEIMKTGEKPGDIIERLHLAQNSDREALRQLVEAVLAENEKSVHDYQNGKKNALGYLVGQCMKHSEGKANPAILREILMEFLE